MPRWLVTFFVAGLYKFDEMGGSVIRRFGGMGYSSFVDAPPLGEFFPGVTRYSRVTPD